MESLYKIGDNVLIKESMIQDVRISIIRTGLQKICLQNMEEEYALLVKLNIGIKCKTVDFLMMAICIL